MANVAVRLAGPLTLALAVPAGLIRGPFGAATALFAVGLVVGGFALTGYAHGRAAAHGPHALQAVALGGMILRLWAYGVLLVLLGPVSWLDAPTLGATIPIAVVVLLAAEVRFVSTQPDLWFVELPAAGTTRPVASTTSDRKDRA
jgi:hypothetical protein